MTNFVEIGQARDKILSLKLDQVGIITEVNHISYQRSVYRRSRAHRPTPGWPPRLTPKVT